MKKIFLILLILSANLCQAQKIDSTYFGIHYIDSTFQEVINVTKSKDSLFNNAVRWFAKNIKNSNVSLKISNKESGEVYGKIILIYEISTKGEFTDYVCAIDKFIYTEIKFDIDIQILCKENKYKYRIDIKDYKISNPHKSACQGGVSSARKEKTKSIIANQINTQNPIEIFNLIQSIKDSMNKSEDTW